MAKNRARAEVQNFEDTSQDIQALWGIFSCRLRLRETYVNVSKLDFRER